MEYTKRGWEVVDRWNIFSGRRLVANCGGYSSNTESVVEENEANAHLIVTAVNACIKVNPDNPMAIAESIADMYEALRNLTDFDEHGGNGQDHYVLVAKAKEALAKAEGK